MFLASTGLPARSMLSTEQDDSLSNQTTHPEVTQPKVKPIHKKYVNKNKEHVKKTSNLSAHHQTTQHHQVAKHEKPNAKHVNQLKPVNNTSPSAQIYDNNS